MTDNIYSSSTQALGQLPRSWIVVRRGLSLIFYGALVGGSLLYLILLIVFCWAVAVKHDPPSFSSHLDAWRGVTSFVFLSSVITHLVGACMCLAAPRCKSWMLAHLLAIVFWVAAVICGIVLLPPSARYDDASFPMKDFVIALIAKAFLLSAAVFLTLFMRGVASLFSKPSLALKISHFMLFQIAVMLAGFVVNDLLKRTQILHDAFRTHKGLIEVGLPFLVLVIGSTYLVWFQLITLATRNAINAVRDPVPES